MNKTILYAIIGLLVIAGLNFLLTAGITALLCYCFSIVFSWKIALGVWVVFFLIQIIFFSGNKEEDK